MRSGEISARLCGRNGVDRSIAPAACLAIMATAIGGRPERAASGASPLALSAHVL